MKDWDRAACVNALREMITILKQDDLTPVSPEAARRLLHVSAMVRGWTMLHFDQGVIRPITCGADDGLQPADRMK